MSPFSLSIFTLLFTSYSVDLDIEGGLPTFYGDFVNQIRTHTDSAKKQCVAIYKIVYGVRAKRSIPVPLLQVLYHSGASMSVPRCEPRTGSKCFSI